jgi:uncharacterized surface protein with fasciclin (FAS1) repeats
MRMTKMVLVVPALVLFTACADADPAAVQADPVMSAAAGAPAARAASAGPTIVDVALSVNAESGEFSTLIAAVLAAGLADELSAKGQRTVFAPTDAAFAALGLNAGNIGTALSREALTNILLYHVSPGRREAASVVTSTRLRMANKRFTFVSLRADGAYINDSRIVATDVMAANGIIHVIDAVLLP